MPQKLEISDPITPNAAAQNQETFDINVPLAATAAYISAHARPVWNAVNANSVLQDDGPDIPPSSSGYTCTCDQTDKIKSC